MTVKTRVYKIVSIIVTIAMILSAWPQALWAKVLNMPQTNVSYALSDFSELTMPIGGKGSNSLPIVTDMLPPSVTSQLSHVDSNLMAIGTADSTIISLQNFQNLTSTPTPISTSLTNPISIYREQSLHTASSAVSNTLIVTFTVSNNQPPVNFPLLSPDVTITDTLVAMSNYTVENDPNVIRNVILSNDILPHTNYLGSSVQPDTKGNVYAWNLGDIPPLSNCQLSDGVAQLVFTHEGSCAICVIQAATLAGEVLAHACATGQNWHGRIPDV
jgi:hypothetical protein